LSTLGVMLHRFSSPAIPMPKALRPAAANSVSREIKGLVKIDSKVA
jgi:hypothetical protein